MKVLLLLVAVFATLLYSTEATCEEEYPYAFDCAGKGTPLWYRTPEGRCSFGCKSGDAILKCEKVHPAPNTSEYDHVCRGKAEDYDCRGQAVPTYFQDNTGKCGFHCQNDDMVFVCANIWKAE